MQVEPRPQGLEIFRVLGEFCEEFHFDGAQKRFGCPKSQAHLQDAIGLWLVHCIFDLRMIAQYSKSEWAVVGNSGLIDRSQLSVGRIQCLESARSQSTAGKIGHEIDPEIGPGGESHDRDAHGNRWVERSTGNVAHGKRSHHHCKTDGKAIKRIARRTLCCCGVQNDVDKSKGEKKLCKEGRQHRQLDWCNSSGTL